MLLLPCASSLSGGKNQMQMAPDHHVEEIEALLRHVGTIVRKRGRDILAHFDITPPQFDALLFLRDGELTMGELCQKMYLACSTATDLIDRMERNDLIERERDSEDRRVIRLKTKPKGLQIIEEVLKARKNYLSTVLAQVADDDKEQLIRALGQIHRLMTKEI
jgi:DNA-binding MarR family transcriptional regulator